MHTLTPADSYKGGIARQQQRREIAVRTSERMQFLGAMAESMEREDITTSMLVATVELAALAVTGDLPAATTAQEARHYMEAAQVAFRMMRLELGESTANTLTASADSASTIAALRARLAALDADSTTSTTDVPTPATDQ